MANDLNCCHFIGRLGADPESRHLPSGGAVTTFRLAVGWKGKEKEGTEWLTIVAFDRLGEICAEYLRKGSQVFIAARVKTETYEKDGEKRYATKFIADRMQMLGSKGDSEPARQAPVSRGPVAPTAPAADPGSDMWDDDIPF